MKSKSERLPRVRNFLFSTPWAMTKPGLEGFVEIIERRLLDEDKSWAIELASKFHGAQPYQPRGTYAVQNEVATIRLVGPIMPRATVMSTSGATSLEEQMRQFQDALSNDDVSAIILDFDTPGGSAMGLEEAALQILAARAQPKPVVALANSMCCSAGYYLASQADMFYATPTAMVGSIGVRMIAESDDRQRKNDGIDVEYTYVSGPLKGGDGPMTAAQKSELDKIGETFFENFKTAIMRARPTLDVESIATGAVWIGAEAQKLGLVDGITTLDKLQAELAA